MLEEPNLLVVVSQHTVGKRIPKVGIAHVANSAFIRLRERHTSRQASVEHGQPVLSSSSLAIAMPWGDFVPVDTPDLAVIGLWTAAELSLVVVVLYVTVHRRWPGYIAKNYGLLLCTALAVSHCCPSVHVKIVRF